MRQRVKEFLSLGLTMAMVAGTIPVNAAEVHNEPVGESVLAEAQAAWDGVEPTGAADHLIINQVYGGGGKADTPIANSFIELYNPTGAAVDLKGYSLAYGAELLELSDVSLGADTSWLIVGAAEQTTDTYLAYDLPEADQSWNVAISNKKYTIQLKNGESVVDEVTAGGSGPAVSKQKSLRRVNYQDTDAVSDWNVLAWGDKTEGVTINEEFVLANAPRNSKGAYGALHAGASEPEYTPVVASDEKIKGVKNGDTTLDMEQYARYNSGALCADGGSLEIVEYDRANGYAYAVSGLKGQIIAVPVSEAANGGVVTPSETVTELTGVEYDVKKLVENAAALPDFTYGDVTSVAISPDGGKLAAAVQHEAYDKAGAIVVFDCGQDGTLSNPKLYPAGVQPDMVTFADDTTVLSADEGEPRNGYGEGCVDPKGTVTVLDLSDESSTQVDFTEYDADALLEQNVLLGMVNGEVISPETDLEPEYIAVSADGASAYISLQEANAVAVLDVKGKQFTGIYSVGFEDYSSVPVDLVSDGKYQPSTYKNLLGARMPDGIAVYEKNGKTYLLSANEGDSREWGDEQAGTYYCNEAKTKDFTGKSIKIIDPEKCAGLPAGNSVMFGGRSFTIFEVTDAGLKEVYDSGANMENVTAQAFPDYFNSSNDDNEADSRSGKKGPEPENVVVGTIGERTYAFLAIERIGGVIAYDITDPQYSMCVNYVNSRDFSEAIKGDVSPEGLCFAQIDGKYMVFAACEVSGTLAVYELTQQSADDIIVLYTNDVHNAYEKSATCLGYASVAQYKKQLESLGYTVELVDNGDAIQGGIIGTLSKGSYIKDIMEKTGYTIAVPGNHEFDYGMKNFLTLADDAAYTYISCNFMDLKENKTVFEPYKIVDYAGKKVAYIGITTPETFTKSTPTYFQDEHGKYIYGFCEGQNGTALYRQVQNAIDAAKADGAESIVVMGHIGTDPSSSPWTSKEIIANTTGIDVFLDGHSHSTIPSEICKDKENKDVLLTSTGTKLTALGELKIHADGTYDSELVTEISMQDTATLQYVDEITAQFKELQETVVAGSEVDLVVNDPKNGKRLVRSQETNLGDLCADAYRTLLGADIAFVNGGGVRDNVSAGDITYGDIISVHPFGNAACLVEATGQQILDALELGARAAGAGESGGFLQVSGLTYDIDLRVPSSVVLDDKNMFVSVNGEYRVKNVKVAGEPLDLTKTYKLASHNYMLKSAGDGYTMFQKDKILQDEVMIDNQVLITYITEKLQGKIKADSIYADPYGAGRIRVITASTDATCETAGSVTYLRGSETVTAENGKAAGHRYETQLIKATTKKNGSIVTKCSVCGSVASTETIAYPKTIKLGKTSYVYSGKVKKPAVTIKTDGGKTLSKSNYTVKYSKGCKSVGTYKVTITFTGNYTGTVTKTFTIVPKATSIAKVTAKSKGFTVKWKKQKTQTTGYELQYSTSSRFTKKTTKTVTIAKNATVSKTIHRLRAKKKYFVRIRTYKTVKTGTKRTKQYSAWSKTKKVTTKK